MTHESDEMYYKGRNTLAEEIILYKLQGYQYSEIKEILKISGNNDKVSRWVSLVKESNPDLYFLYKKVKSEKHPEVLFYRKVVILDMYKSKEALYKAYTVNEIKDLEAKLAIYDKSKKMVSKLMIRISKLK